MLSTMVVVFAQPTHFVILLLPLVLFLAEVPAQESSIKLGPISTKGTAINRTSTMKAIILSTALLLGFRGARRVLSLFYGRSTGL